MDLFRALKQKHGGDTVEASDRALALTQHLVQLNPANYSVWQYRARVLGQMAADPAQHHYLEDELEFMVAFAVTYMKNYQVW